MFTRLPPGRYAIIVVHDEDDDGRLSIWHESTLSHIGDGALETSGIVVKRARRVNRTRQPKVKRSMTSHTGLG